MSKWFKFNGRHNNIYFLRFSSIERKQIPIVPKILHDYLFNDIPTNPLDKKRYKIEDIKIPTLPKLYCEGNILKHFELLGEKFNKNYDNYLIKAFLTKEIPPMPKEWAFIEGWVKYENDKPIKIDYPDEDFLVFDVEVCVQDGRLPTLAVALSNTSWYSWCSERLIKDTPVPVYSKIDHLIPLEGLDKDSREKIIIGHNVSFDRSRVREQYYDNASKIAFWDTMSMAIAMYSVSDSQTTFYDKKDYNPSIHSEYSWLEQWKETVTKYNLKDLYNFLVPFDDENHINVEKETRDLFVVGDIQQIRDEFQRLTQYCATDVLATLQIYQKMYNEFMYRFPSQITRYGMIKMANVYLPINQYWNGFQEFCDDEYKKIVNKLRNDIIGFIQQLIDNLKDNYEKDPWMFDCDWNIDKNKNLPKWFLTCLSNFKNNDLDNVELKFKSNELPKVFGVCYGIYPVHYIKKYGWGYLKPINKSKNSFKNLETFDIPNMPEEEIISLIESNKSKGFNKIKDESKPVGKFKLLLFYRLPHPTNSTGNVGSIFSKSHQSLFSDNILFSTRGSEIANCIINNLAKTTYWVNFQKRFKDELPIWKDDNCNYGVIAPSVVPAGTITRRSTHRLWLTVTASKKDVIGSGLKSLIQAPKGYKIVGADVDSQEQWLAAIMGDSIKKNKYIGDSLFSYLVLMGNKNEGTDLHSVVAKESGISRNIAKILNYARLYGSGPSHAVSVLIKHNVPITEAKKLAQKTFEKTKGKQGLYVEINKGYIKFFLPWYKKTRDENEFKTLVHFNDRIFVRIGDNVNENYTTNIVKEEFIKYAKTSLINDLPNSEIKFFKLLLENIEKKCFKKTIYKLYYDGIESDTFNYLNIILDKPELRTPILNCKLGNGFHPRPKYSTGSIHFLNFFRRSITNWIIQSSAVDFLHMLLINMEWLCQKYNIDARFCISIHDEVRYLVKDEDVYRAALALNLSNLMVRAAISQRLGIHQIPYSTAFFSQVDIDTILRKEVDEDVTCSENSTIESGISLTYDEIYEKTNGKL
ncbi:DNA polymerase subunit gamma-1 [Strongyloides ratti]|uniref:Mitochondrial DNA polymerase catalytic subunit n=1 Tax=Strongyloides ratti TaxID=34506 RepID=A0A090LEY8_STRRB|nr:DNA polymerase subunit gamma-1 [Strongyloides ratti]CEF68361.1 DNA polymerase subunit gamma-1 [Strongyloides ratti]